MADKKDELIPEKRMEDMSVAPADPKNEDAAEKEKTSEKDAPRNEDNLEEGLEDTMDASDPPSSLQP